MAKFVVAFRDRADAESVASLLRESGYEVIRVCTALGEHVLGQYIEGKEKEWDAYRTHVSKWETDRYLVMY